MPTSKAIIVAGGSSRRMNGVDKIFAEIAGKPVIAYTIDAFERSNSIDGIILVLPNQNMEKGKSLIQKYGYKKVEMVCEGGATRQQSVSNGLRFAKNCDFAIVHDGARPCVTEETIEAGIKEAQEAGIAIAASPVSDTIKQVDDSLHVEKTLDRNKLRSIHTPQVFRLEILEKIHEDPKFDATDDAGLAESMGYRVKVYGDSYDNIKITTLGDLATAESILSRRNRSSK